MAITVLKHRVPWGPFTRAQIEDGLVRGDFTLSYLAHAPGLKEWLPLGEVLHFLDRGTDLPPVPETNDLPPVPQRGEAAASRPPVLAVPPALPRQAVPMPDATSAKQPERVLKLAPFPARAVAFFIDCGILFIPISTVFALGALMITVGGWWNHADSESQRQEWALLKRNFGQLVMLIAVGFGWFYAAGLECSRWQGTVGKQWMGMKVTDVHGERISFLRATGRHLAKYLSALPCFLGFIMALFSSRGRALHDRLANTRVVRS